MSPVQAWPADITAVTNLRSFNQKSRSQPSSTPRTDIEQDLHSNDTPVGLWKLEHSS